MAALNYAKEYSRALAQAYPFVLHFGALYNTENDTRYRWVNSRTIEIPNITTTGRVNADRDTISTAQRNYDNAWETKTLSNSRKWSTLVHPRDIDETNSVTTIQNITKTFNETQKFPEKDAYLISKLYSDWITSVTAEGYTGHTADTTVLSTANVLTVFDQLMLNMDEANVPADGRILYVTSTVKQIIKNAIEIVRRNGESSIERDVSRIDEVKIESVPSVLMKTKYNFTTGYKVATDAQQVNMFLVHPSAVITPEAYDFAQLDPPSATSEGKYVYYEESFDDAFILNKRADALQFNVTASA